MTASGGRLWSWFRELLPVLGRFLGVGLGATVIDIVLFNLFRQVAHLSPLPSKALSFVITVTTTYGAFRKWAFPDTAGEATPRQFVFFAVLAGAALAVSELCLVVSYYGLGLRTPLETNISANVLGTGLGTVIRFLVYRRWVFAQPRSAAEAALSTTA